MKLESINQFDHPSKEAIQDALNKANEIINSPDYSSAYSLDKRTTPVFQENDTENIQRAVEKMIEKDINKIDERSTQILDIPDRQEKQITDLGGDPTIVTEKLKPEFNLLKTIRDSVSGKFAKLAGITSIIGMAHSDISRNPEKEKLQQRERIEVVKNDKEISEFFKKIGMDSVATVDVIKDLHVLFNNEEMVYEVPGVLNVADTLQRLHNFEFLLNKENRKKIIDIDRQFEISPDYVLRFLKNEDDLKALISSKDFYKTVFPKIQEIRSMFPDSDENPSVNFIDFTNKFEGLNNPEYKKALEFVLSKSFKAYIQDFQGLPKEIINIYTNKDLHDFVNELDKRGIWFDQTISWEPNKISQDKLLNDLDKNENKEIRELFDEKSPLGRTEIAALTSDEPWALNEKTLLNDPHTRETITFLKENSCSIRTFFFFDKETKEKILHNEQYRQALIFLMQELKSNPDNLWHDVPNLIGYYESGNNIDLVRMKKDVDRIQRVGKINIGYFYNSIRDEKIKSFEPILMTSPGGEVKINNFSNDPAFYYIIDRMNLLVETPKCLDGMSKSMQKEWVMRIARNMYITKTEPTQENFERVFNETVSMRSDIETLNISLFKGKNVALFAHNEVVPEQNNLARFGTPFTVGGVNSQKPLDFEMFKSSNNTPEELQKKKREFLNYISNHAKLTVLVDAHGSPDGIYLTNGIPNKEGKIDQTNDYEYVSVSEMVFSLEKRYDNGITDTPILVFSTCFNQDYARSLYDMIMSINETKQKNIPLPIIGGDTEFGQYSYDDFDEKYYNKFFEALLEGKKDTKIIDFIDIEEHAQEKGIITNPSLFIPVQENSVSKKVKDSKKQTFFQIAETIDKTKKQISHMDSFVRSVQDGTLNDQTASYFEAAQPQTAKAIREVLKKKKANNEQDKNIV